MEFYEIYVVYRMIQNAIGFYSSRLIILFLVLLLFVLILFTGCISTKMQGQETGNVSFGHSLIVNDSYGHTVNLDNPIKRIISLPGTATEALITIGAGNNVVGVSNMTIKENNIMDKLPFAESVGDYWIPDIEKIISLNPDIIISYGINQSKPQNNDKLLKSGIPLLYVKFYDINELPSEMRMLGRITGHESKAERYAQYNEKYLALVKERLDNMSSNESQQPRVFFERWTDYTAMAKDSPYNDLITSFHAKNIAGNISMVSCEVSPEWIIEQNPNVIFRLAIEGENTSEVRDSIISRPGATNIQAVQKGKVYVIQTDMISSPHAVSGYIYMAKALYPDLFQDLDPEAISHEYAREFLPGTDRADSFSPSL